MNENLPFGLISIIIFLLLAFKEKKEKEEIENKKPKKTPKELLMYKDLRENALKYKKSDTNLNDENPLYGIVMDINLGNDIITLFTLREGPIEIYHSKGSIIILESEDNLVAAMETVEYFKIAGEVYKKGIKADHIELPNINSTNFFFLTTEGRRIIIEDMRLIEQNTSELCEIYDRANRIILEILEQIERDSDDDLTDFINLN